MNPLVLVIDDDCEELLFIGEAFKKHEEKTRIVTLEGGEQALAYIFACEPNAMPDFILLDINMPKIDGFSVLKQLKANERTKDIPVYMLSTSDNPKDMSMAKEYGAVAYYCKPFSYDGYRDIINRILKTQRDAASGSKEL